MLQKSTSSNSRGGDVAVSTAVAGGGGGRRERRGQFAAGVQWLAAPGVKSLDDDCMYVVRPTDDGGVEVGVGFMAKKTTATRQRPQPQPQRNRTAGARRADSQAWVSRPSLQSRY